MTMGDTNDEKMEFHDCKEAQGYKFKEQKDKLVDF